MLDVLRGGVPSRLILMGMSSSRKAREPINGAARRCRAAADNAASGVTSALPDAATRPAAPRQPLDPALPIAEECCGASRTASPQTCRGPLDVTRRAGLLTDARGTRWSVQVRPHGQQLRLEEPARKGRQDDRRETDHGAIDHQARIADHPGLEKPVAERKGRYE